MDEVETAEIICAGCCGEAVSSAFPEDDAESVFMFSAGSIPNALIVGLVFMSTFPKDDAESVFMFSAGLIPNALIVGLVFMSTLLASRNRAF
jgi:hypothetical protein